MKNKLIALLCALVLCLGMAAPGYAAEAGIAGQQNAVSVSGYSIAAVKADGSLWAWGTGTYGFNSTSSRSAPTSPTKIMTDVASVYNWTEGWDGRSDVPSPCIAILKRDGSLWLLGDGYIVFGFNNRPEDSSTPAKVTDQVAAVSSAENVLAVVKKDGSLWMYGYEWMYGYKNNPEKVMDNVSAVSTCGGTTAAVKTDGSLWMWGDNFYGQLGIGSTSRQDEPVKVLDNVASVSVCHTHTAAVKTDGSLWMWGDNSYGELGNGMVHNTYATLTGYDDNEKEVTAQRAIQTTPVKVMDGVASVSVNGGEGHSTHAVKTDGSLWCWGDNSTGQLGNGGASNRTASVPLSHADGYLAYDSCPIQDVPVKVMDGAVSISGNGGTTAVVKQDGTLWAAGWNAASFDSSSRRSFEKVLDGVAVPKTAVPTVGGFTDVKQSDYYAEAVLWAVDHNITSGTGNNTFSPDNICTKAQILTFIWRAVGEPAPKGSNPFRDVQSGDYYYNAALWAYERGMVSGASFAGDELCTRSMAVTYLWKAAGSPTAPVSNMFSDVSAAADYAQAVAWAVNYGVTSGTGGGLFSPNAVCTRGQIVTFLFRGI